MLKKIVIFSMMAALTVGCLREGDSIDCPDEPIIEMPGPELELKDDTSFLIPEDVGDMYLYVFEQIDDDSKKGILRDIIKVKSEDLEKGSVVIPGLKEGKKYTLVAWGSSSDELKEGFTAAKANGADPSLYEEVVKDDTTLEDFRMMINSNILPPAEGEPGNISPYMDLFDDLFHAVATDIEPDTTGAEFRFIKNTHLLKVTINGIQNIGMLTRAAVESPVKVFVVGKNGMYNFANSVATYAQDLRYEPAIKEEDITPTSVYVEIKILRLEIAKHNVFSPVLLYLQDKTTSKNIIEPLNIVQQIFKDGRFESQPELDAVYELPINITIDAEDGIKITINDWEIEDLDPITA